MRIVLHDYGGYAFTVQLARTLAMRGHEVLYLHSSGLITPKGPMEVTVDDPSGLAIEAIEIGKGRGTRRADLRRLIQERRYGGALGSRIRSAAPDVVISANTPLDAQANALKSAHAVGSAFVFWMQDVYSRAVANLIGRRSSIAGKVAGARYARIEQRLAVASDAVVLASEQLEWVTSGWGLPQDRVTVVPNWAPLDGDIASTPKANAWSREHGLGAVPVLTYAGTLGRKHNPQLLIALADGVPDASVVVVAEGVGATWLSERAADHPNLMVLPLQPADRVAQVLRSADVLIALLEHDASEFSEPSKVLSYLTAGRPILAAIPGSNQAAKSIIEAGAGFVVDPRNPDDFVAAAQTLLGADAIRKEASRRGLEYARARFDINLITDRFEEVFASACGQIATR